MGKCKPCEVNVNIVNAGNAPLPPPPRSVGYYYPYWWWWPIPSPSPSDCAEICGDDLDNLNNDLDYLVSVLGAWVAKVEAGVVKPEPRNVSEETNDKGQEIIEKVQKIKGYVERLYPLYVPPFTVSPTEVDQTWLMNRLVKLPNFSTSKWLPLDGKYYAIPLDDWKRIATWDRTSGHKYYEDKFDCDKYAMHFKSRVAWFFGVNTVAVVIDYGTGHAYNIVFPTDGNPIIYEPQTDQFIPIDERDTSTYGLNNYYILV